MHLLLFDVEQLGGNQSSFTDSIYTRLQHLSIEHSAHRVTQHTNPYSYRVLTLSGLNAEWGPSASIEVSGNGKS